MRRLDLLKLWTGTKLVANRWLREMRTRPRVGRKRTRTRRLLAWLVRVRLLMELLMERRLVLWKRLRRLRWQTLPTDLRPGLDYRQPHVITTLKARHEQTHVVNAKRSVPTSVNAAGDMEALSSSSDCCREAGTTACEDAHLVGGMHLHVYQP